MNPNFPYNHRLHATRGWSLPAALGRARQLGLAGAAFPWRTIDGDECSAYWPAGTAAFHINADIADAVVRYTAATGDLVFEREAGLELLLHTARLWLSLGHHDPHGVFHLTGSPGRSSTARSPTTTPTPNVMAQQDLGAAADASERHPDLAASLGVDDEETAAWRDAARRIALPFNKELGVHEQSAGFTSHQVWDFAGTPADRYPMLLRVPYFDLYRKQVIKQADLILAMHLRGDAFTKEEKTHNFAYDEPLSVRDSSLSAGSQAVMAAEVGQLRLAYDYVGEAAMMDLANLERNTRDGLHIASPAGTWTALVAGFGGMRHHQDALSFTPRLSEQLRRPAFAVQFRRCCVRVDNSHQQATCTLLPGSQLEIHHHGGPLQVTRDVSRSGPMPTVLDLNRSSRPAVVPPAADRRVATSASAPVNA